jgi:hypothetical protein
LNKEKLLREYIDKFGKPLKDGNSEVKVVLPKPEYGKIDYSKEEEQIEEDADEWSRKMKELARLREKKRRGEELTEEEQKRFV